MTMKIGQIETTGVPGRRDAFHSPSVLVRGEGNLRAGDSVRFVDNTYTAVRLSGLDDRHAIIDPFIRGVGQMPYSIKPGDLFWVMLVPDSVGNLVHHFDVTTDLPAPEPEPTFTEEYGAMSDWERADMERCRQEGCS